MSTCNLLILYYSRHGATRRLAELIAEGVESVPNCQALLRTVPDVSAVCEATEKSIPEQGSPYAEYADLAACDGIALGSPTRFGNMASAMKYFWDGSTAQWLSGALAGKPASVFTSTGSLHGGQETTLLSMMLPLLHHGMLIMGLPYTQPELSSTTSGGTPYGVTHLAGDRGQYAISKDEEQLAIAQGRRLAEIALQLKKSS